MLKTQHIAAERLRTFFRPRSIALVGATDNSRWSLFTFDNLQKCAFAGPIYLINPNREIVHGKKALKSLKDLPETVDLAFIMVATPRVLAVVKEAAAMGIRQFIVLTSGFSEIGEEGARLEQELVAFARAHDLLILGPNGNGFINVQDQIIPYGLPVFYPLVAGPVGVVLQSGALASAVLAFAQAHSIGLSLLVSMGNESMLSVTDIVDYLLEDEATRVIALFLESIRHPAELKRIAARARERQKAIVALKIGRSEASSRTALAHTGALVGNDMINDAAFRQLGIVRVHSLEDLLTTAGLIGYSGALPGRRMGVVTPSGGACDILSDLADNAGISMPDFAPETVERLQAILPPFATAHNPLDVTGYVVVDGTLQQRALAVVGSDPNIDFILNLVSIETVREATPLVLEGIVEQYQQLANMIRDARHPVVHVTNTCIDLSQVSHAIVERTGLHFSAGLEHGMRALGQLLWWSDWIKSAQAGEQRGLESAPPQTFEHKGTWSEVQARTLLQQAGIPVTPGELARSADEAVQAAQRLGMPVALKVQSAAIPHKSDVGGVALHLNSEQAVHHGFTAMLELVQAARPDAALEGILVSPMRAGGTELLVSVVHDQVWGHVLTLGLGGIWTEALRDTAIRLLPVEHAEIEAMLGELRGAAVLRGARGRAAIDMQALSDIIYRISMLAYCLGPELHTLEINPLWIDAERIEALDVLLDWQA
ncbi:MAG: acetate--CoA ligase family protein [Ktedonobacteraceae bacterium]